MREFLINQNDAGQRVDKFLQKALPQLPTALLYKYLRIKRIKRNGKRTQAADRLEPADRLQLYINDTFFAQQPPERAFLLAPTKLSVLYEDENLLVADKRPGLLVHEDDGGENDTLINRILHYLYEKGEYCPDAENSFAPALCNRIDRNTGGLVLAAKNAATLRVLNEKIKEREIQKLYLCLLHGHLEKPADTLQGFLRKESGANTVEVFDRPIPGGRTILTKYRVLGEKGRFTLAEVDLLTGRTHQIRAHFAHIGHPLLGDAKYGQNRRNAGTGYKYQALYAYKLVFTFPTDAGHLEYLRGKEVTAPDVWFCRDFWEGKLR